MTGGVDRKTVVGRHHPTRTTSNPKSPAQLGNGRFAFGADITGLQTFYPFAILSEWGWKHDPRPKDAQHGQYAGQHWNVSGRSVRFDMSDISAAAESQWLVANPNRVNLGRIGFWFDSGVEVREEDLHDNVQTVDIWNGVIRSQFRWRTQQTQVETRVHPDMDCVSIILTSKAFTSGELGVFFDFPYCSGEKKFSAPYVGDYEHDDAHETMLLELSNGIARLYRRMDDAFYMVVLTWDAPATLQRTTGHRFLLKASDTTTDKIEITATYINGVATAANGPKDTIAACDAAWPAFWEAGAAIDLSSSRDARWLELERRVILSQYILSVNCLGNYPPQESGLVNLGWRGKFHMEMPWWHMAYLELFGRRNHIDRAILQTYDRFLSSSRERAKAQGYDGARWPKMTDPSGRAGPGEINALLVWQQPHPIAFAELEYSVTHSRNTLEKWKEVIAATADFMVSFAVWNEREGEYDLSPPMHIVSENTDPTTTRNPTFELTYWRFGLSTAIHWWERLGLTPNQRWKNVRDKLAPCPIENGAYVIHEGLIGEDMWNKYNFEHPALAGIYGWLPGDVDVEVTRATSQLIWRHWRFNDCWGWDFGVLAMNAARLRDQERAVDFMLHESFRFDDIGLADAGSRAPFPYMPANGSLLYAFAFMAAGWTGIGDKEEAPGFPKDWVVRWEGLQKAL